MKKWITAMTVIIAVAAAGGCSALKSKVKKAAAEATKTGIKSGVEAPTK